MRKPWFSCPYSKTNQVLPSSSFLVKLPTQFIQKAENDERFSSMDWNDSDWVTVDLPHTWNAGDVIDEQRGYRRGISWYRKKLFIPSEARDKKITLRFDGVASKADVYLNGKLLQTHLGAYTANRFSFPTSQISVISTPKAVYAPKWVFNNFPFK